MSRWILRIPQGASRLFSNKLKNALQTHFSDYETEEYAADVDYQHIYKRRRDSLYEAFEFLLLSYPLHVNVVPTTKNELLQYGQYQKNRYDFEQCNVELLQNELVNFTASLLHIIRYSWQLSYDNESIELLNEAEQYLLMKKGRQHLATLSYIQIDNHTHYVLQEERSIIPYDSEILDELKWIKQQDYPKTPEWFRNLSTVEYQFLKLYLDHSNAQRVDFLTDFNDFLNKWHKIEPTIARKELDDLASGWTNASTWFTSFPEHHQKIIKWIVCDKNRCKRFLDLLNLYNTDLKPNQNLPLWYWFLPSHQQFFLQSVLASHDDLTQVVSFLSSRHRTIPMPANFAAHSLYLFQESEFKQVGETKFRSSHIASRDGLKHKWPDFLHHDYASRILKQLFQFNKKAVALFQTLISPIDLLGIPIVPDKDLNDIATQVINTLCSNGFIEATIIKTNHPYNIAKHLLYTLSNDTSCCDLIKKAETCSENAKLNEVLNDYHSELNSGFGTATYKDYYGRELYLSSLEQLLIHEIDGFSYGSCVSGKDRKALEIMHTDALILFREWKGSLPDFTQSEHRIPFTTIFAHIFLTRHHQTHAGQNAPGSEGIKTPFTYLPGDIVNEILNLCNNQKVLTNEDCLASNNEVKNIFPRSWVKPILHYISQPKLNGHHIISYITAQLLGESRCKLIYEKLSIILENEFCTYYPSFYRSEPTGIQSLRTLIDNATNKTSYKELITDVFQIVLSRPETSVYRNKETAALYEKLTSIINYCKQYKKPYEEDEINKLWPVFEATEHQDSVLMIS